MFRGILPKEVAFYDYFEKLTTLNVQVSKIFLKMVEGNKNIIESSLEIKKLEREGERITRTSIDLLHRTFITPFDRDDIFQLLKGLDNFSDDINAATFRLTHYEINDIRHETIEFAQIIMSCALEIEAAVKGLRRIKKHPEMRQNCVKVHELEYQSDEILRNAIASLYHQEDIMLLIKWKEIYARLEKAVDRMEKVANIIESIMIDNS
jgi:uncharacterized protein Yka (UPF0111/DUF47 family)